MDFLSGIGTYSWATFGVVLLSAIIAYFKSRSENKKRKTEEVDSARTAYRKALESGTPEQIMLAKRRYEKVKKALSVVVLASLCAVSTSCLSRPERVLPVGEYILTPVAGDVVPALPHGESRWLLLTVPTGTDLIIERE